MPRVLCVALLVCYHCFSTTSTSASCYKYFKIMEFYSYQPQVREEGSHHYCCLLSRSTFFTYFPVQLLYLKFYCSISASATIIAILLIQAYYSSPLFQHLYWYCSDSTFDHFLLSATGITITNDPLLLLLFVWCHQLYLTCYLHSLRPGSLQQAYTPCLLEAFDRVA